MNEIGGSAPLTHQSTFDSRLAYVQSNIPLPSHQTSYPYPAYNNNPLPARPGSSSGLNARPDYSHRPSASSAPLLHREAMTHPGCVLCGLVRSCGSNPASPALSPQDNTTCLPSSSRTPSSAAGFADSSAPGPYHHPFERTQSPAPDGRRTGNRVGGREIVYHDKDITVYKAEGKERLCQDGRHIIIVVNEHLQSVYEFVSLFSCHVEIGRDSYGKGRIRYTAVEPHTRHSRANIEFCGCCRRRSGKGQGKGNVARGICRKYHK